MRRRAGRATERSNGASEAQDRSPPPVAARAVHHVGLVASDVDRLRAFYADVLGLPAAEPIGGIPFLRAGGTRLELLAEPRPPGWAHLALEVADVDAAYHALAARGVRFHVPPEDFPPKKPRVRIAFFRDPEGNEVELLQTL